MKGLDLLFTLFCFSTAASDQSHVVNLDPSNFDEIVIKSGKPSLVKFFAPWCGHCKSLEPTWEKLATSFSSQSEVITIAKVDAEAHRSLGQKYGIKGYPTIKYFDGKSKEPVKDYDSGRDLESIQEWLKAETNVKLKVKKELPSAVVTLTDGNFHTVVNGTKHVLVKFYAPWCGHCKTLAPIYDTLARNFIDEEHVVIAKLDADAPTGKTTAAKYGISGFPTLKFFSKDSTEPETYDNQRSEEALAQFLNTKAGTFRAVGGGLNEMAGRISAFDEVAEKLVKGDASSLKDVSETIKKLAEESNEPYAAYYVKVLDKLSKNDEDAERELKRIQGILKKGGLARKKVDEFTCKTNILSRFVLEKKPEVKDEL